MKKYVSVAVLLLLLGCAGGESETAAVPPESQDSNIGDAEGSAAVPERVIPPEALPAPAEEDDETAGESEDSDIKSVMTSCGGRQIPLI